MPTANFFSGNLCVPIWTVPVNALWQRISACIIAFLLAGLSRPSFTVILFSAAQNRRGYDQYYLATAAWHPDFVFNTVAVNFHYMELLLPSSKPESIL